MVSPRVRSWSRAPLVGALALCVVAFLALVSLAPTPIDGAIIQPPAGQKSKVYIKMQMLALSTIDGVAQTFVMDFFLLNVWAAPLPAGSTLACPTITNCSSIAKADIDDNFWLPSLQFGNSRNDIIALNPEPYSLIPGPSFPVSETLPDGWVWLQSDQRYQVEFATDLNMNAFPFDIQHLEMQLESTWRADRVEVVYATPGLLEEITAEIAQTIGWDFLDSGLGAYNKSYTYNSGSFSRITLTTSWERQPQYYLTKIVAGTMLLVWMCIWNFSLQIDVSDRMMGTLQVFTGLISFLFVASGDTPKLPYQTRLDLFMMFSFCIVAFIMFIHGVLYYFREQGFAGTKADRLEDLEAQKRREFIAKRSRNSRRTAPARANSQYAPGTDMASPSGSGSMEMPPSQHSARAEALGPNAPIKNAFDDGSASVPVSPDAAAGAEQEDIKVVASPEGGHARAASMNMEGLSSRSVAEPPDETEGWEVRLNDWSHWSLVSWFASLACTRKWDVIIVPFLFLFYTIGSAAILGRAASDGSNA